VGWGRGESGKRKEAKSKINVCVKFRMGCLSEQRRTPPFHHLGIECELGAREWARRVKIKIRVKIGMFAGAARWHMLLLLRLKRICRSSRNLRTRQSGVVADCSAEPLQKVRSNLRAAESAR
jgi:hypothetical protein